MIENLLPLKIPPGLYSNGTMYQAQGRWAAGNLIRFYEGEIRPIGGWTERSKSGDTPTGTPVAAVSWQTAGGTPWLAWGSSDGKLWVMDGSNVVSEITPTPAPDWDGEWQLTVFGSYLVATFGDDAPGGTDIRTFIWLADADDPAIEAFTDADGVLSSYAAFVTNERFLVLLRGKDGSNFEARTGVDTDYSERRIYWAPQEEYATFVPDIDNTAGDLDLATNGKLMAGLAARNQNLIWTDVDLWTLDYIGGTLVYGAKLAGNHCGIVSKRAAVAVDAGVFWMGKDKFHVYDGFVQTVPCEVSDYIFNNFNNARAGQVWALANPRFNEVTWFYPSNSATGAYADAYVTYNYLEKHWTYGDLRRQAGVTQQFGRTKTPVLLDGVHVYDHEVGNARTGSAPFLESGPIQLGNGDRLMRLQGIVPDDRTAGDVSLILYYSHAPDAEETAVGIFALGTYTPLRVTARQIRIRLDEVNDVGWRVGEIRLAVLPAERRGTGASRSEPSNPEIAWPLSLEITPTSATLNPTDTQLFTAVVKDANDEVLEGYTVTWESETEATGTIASTTALTGTFTAIAEGTSNVTARIDSLGLVSNTAVVTVANDVFTVLTFVNDNENDVINYPTREQAQRFYYLRVNSGSGNVEYLVVGAGGGGCHVGGTGVAGGGGGGGRVRSGTLAVSPGDYLVEVGGRGRRGDSISVADGVAGGDSVLYEGPTTGATPIRAEGGGGGGGSAAQNSRNGHDGGCGGGAGCTINASPATHTGGAAAGTYGDGADMTDATSAGGLKGGGGGGAGEDATDEGQDGGDGVSSDITGSAQYYGGGGGGGNGNSSAYGVGTGGLGGGGTPGDEATVDGDDETGGGGGATRRQPSHVRSGYGGTGVVIIRFNAGDIDAEIAEL